MIYTHINTYSHNAPYLVHIKLTQVLT